MWNSFPYGSRPEEGRQVPIICLDRQFGTTFLDFGNWQCGHGWKSAVSYGCRRDVLGWFDLPDFPADWRPKAPEIKGNQ